jgi:phage shock protein A
VSKGKKSREILRRDWDEDEEMTAGEDFELDDTNTEGEPVSRETYLVKRLEKLHEDFAGEANQLTAQADEAEEQVWRLRASAASLREAAEGVSRAIKEFRQQWDVTTKRLKEREARRGSTSKEEESESSFARALRRGGE